MYYHTTRDGNKMKLSDMSDYHLDCTMNKLRQMAKEGVVVRSGGGTTAEDMWYDEDTIYGDEALDYLNYQKYQDEYNRRIVKFENKKEPVTKNEKMKRYTFQVIRMNNGKKEVVKEKGLFSEPLETKDGGFVSYYDYKKKVDELEYQINTLLIEKADEQRNFNSVYLWYEQEMNRRDEMITELTTSFENLKTFIRELMNQVGKL